MHQECALCSQRSDESTETGVVDGSEPPCGCWESNPGPLQGNHLASPLSEWLHIKELQIQAENTWSYNAESIGPWVQSSAHTHKITNISIGLAS